jgi:D-alanyl-D-alanine dipeptidase/carboxypeptidase
MKIVSIPEENICKGPLVLVNAQHPVKTSCDIRLLPVEESGGVYLEKKATSLLAQIFRELGNGGRIVPVSGYRSRSGQESLYRHSLRDHGEAFTRKYVAQPGCSEHETGLAIDLAEASDSIDTLCPSFPYTGLCGDFRRLAAKYGFIERYGEDKEALTGISHEPWHFRYVGYPHSLLMQERNLCLEEYIALLRRYPHDGEHLHFKQTEIFFAGAEAAAAGLLLPDDCTQISGNNADGYIVTVWRWAM